MNTDARLTAKLLSACPPDSAQKEKLEDVLSKKYGKAVELVWQEDRTAQGGFRIELGSEVIDWTAEGRLEQLKERLTGLKSEGSVIPLIRDAVKSWVPEVCAREVGSVLTVADGIAYVEGLEGATYGEILLFEGGIRGMVQELRSGRIGCILFGRVEASGGWLCWIGSKYNKYRYLFALTDNVTKIDVQCIAYDTHGLYREVGASGFDAAHIGSFHVAAVCEFLYSHLFFFP